MMADPEETKQRRVLVFSLAYLPHIGGAEIAVREITARMQGLSFDVVTLALDPNSPRIEDIGNVRIHRVGKRIPRAFKLHKTLFPFIAARYARRLHRAKPFSLVWSIMANRAGFAALFFKKRYPDAPFVLTLQEGDPLEYILRKTRFVSKWFREIFLRADIITAISEFLADFARSMGAVNPVLVIPNGVDYGRFHGKGDPALVQSLRERFTDNGGQSLLVTVSRLVHKNAVDTIIRSLLELPENVKLLVIGTGPLQPYLIALAAELGVSARVLFLGDIPHSKLPSYLSIADIFVRPSRTEGMGNVFIEAMAAGIPVIATTVGGIRDFLRDGENALAVDVDDPHGLAEKVKNILNNSGLAERLAEGGDKTALLYDWNGIAEEMRKVFHTLWA